MPSSPCSNRLCRPNFDSSLTDLPILRSSLLSRNQPGGVLKYQCRRRRMGDFAFVLTHDLVVLQRETYPLPTIDDVLPELANARSFCKMDLSNGYWHCQLDEASSLISTFVTPYGRYRWLRLPFGTNVSSGIFQWKLNERVE